MAMTLETFNHLLPDGIHQIAEQIYGRVPGTLLKFLDTNTVQEKVECHDNIVIDGKLHLPNQNRNCNDSPSDFTGSRNVTAHGKKNEMPIRPNDSRIVLYKSVDPLKRQISSEPRLIPIEYDHHNCDHFRAHFLDSLRNAFHARSITEIDPNEAGNIIFDRYLEQCLNLDKRLKTSSLPIQFEKHYLVKNDFGRLNVGVCYVNAYIVCETTKTWTQKHQTQMTYDVTIEFNGLSQDYEKIKRFGEMLVNNDVQTIIEMIEEKNKLTWEGFLKKK
ncbi:unnamed protein product [Rotaria sp. Silwood2]|nr:unnamed protein product [Rotaria sp. Silwood2]CAF4322040.1 unnamed protein product [Rotaria sp. Silwood2]